MLQDPGELLDYTFDWTSFLGESGSPQDTISTSEWNISPDNGGSPTEPVVTNTSINNIYTTAFVNGVLNGVVYRLTNIITTAMGRRSEQSITIRGHER